MFYCQPDGAQFNVEVTLIDFDVVVGYSIIKGPNLVGSFEDKDGNEYLIVASETLHDTPRK